MKIDVVENTSQPQRSKRALDFTAQLDANDCRSDLDLIGMQNVHLPPKMKTAAFDIIIVVTVECHDVALSTLA